MLTIYDPDRRSRQMRKPHGRNSLLTDTTALDEARERPGRPTTSHLLCAEGVAQRVGRAGFAVGEGPGPAGSAVLEGFGRPPEAQLAASWCLWSLRTDESQVLWTVEGSFEIVVVGCG